MSAFFCFDNICKHFKEGAFLRISGEVKPGQLLMVRGPSGSGKSTLLKILARLIKPEQGKVTFRGQDWMSISPQQWRQTIQYVSQQPVMFEGTVIDNLLLPFKLNQNKLPGDHKTNIMELFNRLGLVESILQQDAQTLSGGQAARVAVTRALLVNPDILLLDEPTAYLDTDSSQKFNQLMQDWLKKGERAIIEVSHHDANIDELPGTKILSVSGKGEPGI